MSFINILVAAANWFWGIPILVLLVGGGLYLSTRLGFFQFRYFGYILKETFGKMFKKTEGEGSVSNFQAAATALASCIGGSYSWGSCCNSSRRSRCSFLDVDYSPCRYGH